MAIVTGIFLAIGVLVASIGFIFWWKNQEEEKRKGHRYPPAFPSLPLIGSLPFLRGLNNVPEFLMKCSDKYGPMFTFMVGRRMILVLNSRDSIVDAYINHLSSFSGRACMFLEAKVNPNRKGLVTKSTDAEWKRLHHLSLSLLKDFGFGVKNQMEEKILTEVEMMVDWVKKKNGQSFTPRDTIAMIATNVINHIVFGQRRDYEKGIGELYVQVERLFQGFDLTFELSSALRFLPRFKNKFFMYIDSQRIISALLSKEIERIKKPEAEDCFAKRYLQKEGREIDEEQLLWTLRDLTGAGTDTTIDTLLWSLVALANHHIVQDRMRTEIDDVVTRSRFPTMDDQGKLPYAEATMLEVMRWKTLVPLSVPRITLKDVNVNGFFIPANTMVLANLYAAHMDPKLWNNPNEFQPERFLDEDIKVMGRDRVIPFSVGRRSCLGEVLARTEIFLVITAIVQNFIILPPEGQEKVEAKPLEPIGITMIPLPFNIRLIPRA